jgi:hypothetical protein
MNERIKELAEQVYGSAHHDDFKFAELIVLKCLDVVDKEVRDRLSKPYIKVEGPLHVVCQCDKCKTQRPWVGLTDEEIDNSAEQSDNYAAFHGGVRFAEAKLKEKNGG